MPRRRSATADATVWPAILLPDGVFPLGQTMTRAQLQREAMQWSYVVRNRRRWADRESLTEEQARRARALLEELGVSADQLSRLAHAGAAQVAIPYRSEGEGWELRIFPWEFVLSAATRTLRAGQPLTVLRQLSRKDSPNAPTWRAPKSVLYVESAPGPLASRVSFDSERALVRTNLGGQWHEIKNPTREELRRAVHDIRPDVIHLAGFDTHQGLRLAKQPDSDREGPGSGVPAHLDGYLVAGANEELDAVEAEPLAEILTDKGKHRPLLVGCSFWNSAGRTAPMLVAAGVQAAIGFQDSFDDELVEFFFAGLYRRYRHSMSHLADAFLEAWTLIRDRPVGLLGTGVVLWSEAPLVGPRISAAGATSPESRRKLREKVETETRAWHDPGKVRRDRIEDLVKVVVEPLQEFNYSLLHNRRPLFKNFKVLKLKPGHLTDLTVTVDLDGGAARLPYRKTFSVVDEKLDLQGDIHVSLSSSLARSLRESVNASLFVEVDWGSHVLYRETHRVRILPADQWPDTDQDRLWLPSFVLPRDPAIGELLQRALHYVRVLRDDPGAGFDGYQSVDNERDDPTEDVDLQVRALWLAIVNEWRLGYVNPPPTYSLGLDSQRLRTPSTIRTGQSGTCIDLALLFAACLELVDIYPVIFLLEDHAFPGYWRRDTAHDNFLSVSQSPLEELSADLQHAGIAGTQTEPWIFGPTSYDEILRYVEAGELVPIEATQLTGSGGFWDAVQAGAENLRPRREFQGMLDIVKARYVGVTPLPIVEDQS